MEGAGGQDFDFGGEHAECNAHVRRCLKGVGELTGHVWPEATQGLLYAMDRHKRESGSISFAAREWYAWAYDEILRRGAVEIEAMPQGRQVTKDEKNPWTRPVKYKTNHLPFAERAEVPFTNNMAERDLRWSKANRKISGCCRNFAAGVDLARVMSFHLTLGKRKIPVPEAIGAIFRHKPAPA